MLTKLNDVVKNDDVKKDVYNANIKNNENKIPDITDLATNTSLNAKVNKVKNEIPSITNVATTTALTAVEKKASNVSNLVKKNDCNTRISEIENKITTDHDRDNYITTKEFNKLTSENFTTKLAQANSANKSYIANFVKNTNFQGKLNNLNENITSNKTKHTLVENEFNELSEKS